MQDRTSQSVIDRLWTETLRHRPFDIALAFIISAAIGAAAVGFLFSGQDSPESVAPTTAEGPPETTPNPAFGSTIVARVGTTPLARAVQDAVKEGRIGGVAKKIPDEGEWNTSKRFTTFRTGFQQLEDLDPNSPPLLRVGLVLFENGETGNSQILKEFMCSSASDEKPVAALAQRAADMGVQFVLGPPVNYASCAYDLNRLQRLAEIFVDAGVQLIVRGWRPDADVQDRTDALSTGAEQPLIAPSNGQPLTGTTLTKLAGLQAEPNMVVDLSLWPGEEAPLPDQNCASDNAGATIYKLRCAAQKGASVIVIHDQATWTQAAEQLDLWAESVKPSTTERLRAAVRARSTIKPVPAPQTNASRAGAAE